MNTGQVKYPPKSLQDKENLNIQSQISIWQCETKDSAEGHRCNLHYFQMKGLQIVLDNWNSDCELEWV